MSLKLSIEFGVNNNNNNNRHRTHWTQRMLILNGETNKFFCRSIRVHYHHNVSAVSYGESLVYGFERTNHLFIVMKCFWRMMTNVSIHFTKHKRNTSRWLRSSNCDGYRRCIVFRIFPFDSNSNVNAQIEFIKKKYRCFMCVFFSQFTVDCIDW